MSGMWTRAFHFKWWVSLYFLRVRTEDEHQSRSSFPVRGARVQRPRGWAGRVQFHVAVTVKSLGLWHGSTVTNIYWAYRQSFLSFIHEKLLIHESHGPEICWETVYWRKHRTEMSVLTSLVSICLNHFGPGWNISTTIRWIAMKCRADINGSQRMNLTVLGQSFHLFLERSQLFTRWLGTKFRTNKDPRGWILLS